MVGCACEHFYYQPRQSPLSSAARTAPPNIKQATPPSSIKAKFRLAKGSGSSDEDMQEESQLPIMSSLRSMLAVSQASGSGSPPGPAAPEPAATDAKVTPATLAEFLAPEASTQTPPPAAEGPPPAAEVTPATVPFHTPPRTTLAMSPWSGGSSLKLLGGSAFERTDQDEGGGANKGYVPKDSAQDQKAEGGGKATEEEDVGQDQKAEGGGENAKEEEGTQDKEEEGGSEGPVEANSAQDKHEQGSAAVLEKTGVGAAKDQEEKGGALEKRDMGGAMGQEMEGGAKDKDNKKRKQDPKDKNDHKDAGAKKVKKDKKTPLDLKGIQIRFIKELGELVLPWVMPDSDTQIQAAILEARMWCKARHTAKQCRGQFWAHIDKRTKGDVLQAILCVKFWSEATMSTKQVASYRTVDTQALTLYAVGFEKMAHLLAEVVDNGTDLTAKDPLVWRLTDAVVTWAEELAKKSDVYCRRLPGGHLP